MATKTTTNKKTTTRVRKRVSKNISHGQVHIKTSFNNTIVTFSDANGNVVSWCSSGKLGLKGSKKSTPFAAQTCVEEAAKVAKEHGLNTVEVYVKGPGSGREAAIRALQNCELNVTLIKDVSPIAHNGCRPPKVRRV
ncbi:MAG TPA: 30S ribosomal protein S11 [Clostridiales bacterium]|nr:30S ribosomal protein S11 [Clostridiales bacterium]